MTKVSELLAHFEVEDGLWQAFTAEAGSPGEDLRLLATLPRPVVAASLTQASLDDNAHLTAIQAAQVGLVWKLARRLMYVRGGGRWDDWVEEDP